MKKSIVINIETQTETNDVISLCHINEKTIALEISDVARTLFKKNRKVFDKINNSTRLLSGILFRQEILKPMPSTNRLGNEIFNSYRSEDKEISQLYFENNIMRKQQRAISKLGRKFDFDPSEVSGDNTGGNFDPKNLSPDDISESQIICTVEELGIFQKQGVKTIMITDTLEDTKNILEVGYRIEVSVSTEFDEYINFVTNEAEKSLRFLASYLDSLYYNSNYNSELQKFNDDFSKSIMESIGLETFGLSSLSQESVRDSEFGKAAISFYNLSSLLSNSVNYSIYGQILKTILPTDKTNPDFISNFIYKFSSIYDVVYREYFPNKKQTKKKSNTSSRVSEGKSFTNTILASTQEKINLDQEVLGYSLFSEKQTGLNKFTISSYRKRVSAERKKYYPNIDISDTSKFLTPSERSEFSRMDNATSFLTPSALLMGKDRISTNRGMKNLPVNKIREFRLAKSSRAQQIGITRNPVSFSRSQITNDVVSSFNITIAKPAIPILNRSTEESIDPLIDAKHYVGKNSFFVTDNPFQFRKQFKRLLRSEDRKILEVVTDIVPRRFLRDKKAINSIKEIQFSNPSSRVRKLANSKQLKIAEIPPHVKFMMSNDFNPNPQSDPMKNSESREIIEETQKNLFLIKVLVGFEKDEQGFLNISSPIYKKMEMSDLTPGRPVLAKASHYEIPELGIVKDKFAATIYNNLMYIRG